MLQFEVAGTTIQVGDDEGALVLYTDCQYKGKTITIDYFYFPEKKKKCLLASKAKNYYKNEKNNSTY